MKAAVVQDFAQPPQYAEFCDPQPAAGEVLVSVTAASLSQLSKAQASGKHYSSDGGVPFVPGADGVGRLADGRRVYFAFPTYPFGSMAEHSVVGRTLWVPLPADLDDITAAAGANPGMSSWAALTERARFVAGEAVLINGATGVSGRLAIQIAKFLGASHIIATARNAGSDTTLRALGADITIPLDLPPAELAATFKREIENVSVDVVLDYLWGSSAETIIGAVSGHGATARRIRFVQIGSLQSRTISLAAGALRSSGIEIIGSGMGSVSSEGLIRSAKGFLNAILPGNFDIAAQSVPLRDVSEAWMRNGAKERVVLTMGA